MTDLKKRLTDLWAIEESEREKGIKLLTKVYSNILNNPADPKFRDLNFSKIRKKLDKCRPAFYLLFTAGFTQSVDGQRLQWVGNQITRKQLESANQGLLDKIAGKEDIDDGTEYGGVVDPTKTEMIKDRNMIVHRKKKEKKKANDRAQLERIMAKNAQLKAEKEKQKQASSQSSSPPNESSAMDTDNAAETETAEAVDGAESKENDNAENPSENAENAGDGDNADGGDVAMADKESKEDADDVSAQLKAAGLGADELELLEQIKKAKGITHTLKASDLKGLSKEEKVAKFKETQELYRKEKKQNLVQQKLAKEKSRRAGIHAQQEAERKRKEYELKMVAQRKARKKADDKKRKARIKEKIAADKKRRAEQREREKRKKEAEKAAAAKLKAQQEQ